MYDYQSRRKTRSVHGREDVKNIEKGWCFQSADFSVQAGGKDNATGFVTLVRSPAEKTRWHKLPEEMKEDDNGPPLYVIGHGLSLEDAIISANLAAAHAKPISGLTLDITGAL